MASGNLEGMRRRQPRTNVPSKRIKKAWHGTKGLHGMSLKEFARTHDDGPEWLKNKGVKVSRGRR